MAHSVFIYSFVMIVFVFPLSVQAETHTQASSIPPLKYLLRGTSEFYPRCYDCGYCQRSDQLDQNVKIWFRSIRQRFFVFGYGSFRLHVSYNDTLINILKNDFEARRFYIYNFLEAQIQNRPVLREQEQFLKVLYSTLLLELEFFLNKSYPLWDEVNAHVYSRYINYVRLYNRSWVKLSDFESEIDELRRRSSEIFYRNLNLVKEPIFKNGSDYSKELVYLKKQIRVTDYLFFRAWVIFIVLIFLLLWILQGFLFRSHVHNFLTKLQLLFSRLLNFPLK